jgi:NADP-dependent 3-hydroxy acid dehydrogenase YdfG
MGSRFSGRVALVTGASSGIGAAVARALAEEGAALVLFARRLDRLETLAVELTTQGAKVLSIAGDVTRAEDLTAAIERAEAHFGHIDVVVANAGFGVVGRVDSLTTDDFRRQFDTNVFGVLDTVYAALPALRRSRGRLALLGSIAGYLSLPGGAPYAMSKFAVRALASSLRGELKGEGVSVTLISPGFVASEIRQVDNQGRHHERARDPLPRWLPMPADRAARQIVKAIAGRRRERVVTGHGKLLLAIEWLLPGLIARLAVRGVRGRVRTEG